MTDYITDTLYSLSDLQKKHEFTLLKLSEPLLAPSDNSSHTNEPNALQQRTSDASSTSDENPNYPTPASLAADLTHYRDLFTKLRFSYTEQVTKEKFLRYLVSSPSEDVSPAANAELESNLAEVKDTLKQQKNAVNEQLTEIEAHARHLAQWHQELEAQTEELRQLPDTLNSLQSEVQEMRREQGIDGQAETSMGLETTINLVEEREAQLDKVNERLDEVQEQRTRKEMELKKLLDEVELAERERDRATTGAADARRRRNEGRSVIGDDVEGKGRWLQGVEMTMRGLLEAGG